MTVTAAKTLKIETRRLLAALDAVKGARWLPLKGEVEKSLYPLHGIQLELGESGLHVVGTDGKRLGIATLGHEPAEDCQRAAVEFKALAEALRATRGEAEVQVIGHNVLKLSGATVAPVTGTKRELFPEWRDVIPRRGAGSPSVVRDARKLAEILDGHVAELWRRVTESRTAREPIWRDALARRKKVHAEARELRAAQKAELVAIKAKIAAAAKGDRKPIRDELDATRFRHGQALDKLKTQAKELSDSVADKGDDDPNPSAVLTVKGGTWRIKTRDSNTAGEPIDSAIPRERVEGGDDNQIGLNAWFLTDALRAFKGEVEARISTPQAPIVLRGQARKDVPVVFYVMPINL